MSCKITPSNLKSPIHSKFNLSSKTHISESISFASHVAKSRISIKNPNAPNRARRTARIEAIHAPTAESPYEVLGIAQSGSTLSDIKKAYKKMARLYHPDVSPPDRVDEHTKRFIMVKEAYETLTNPQRRALYETNVVDERMEEKGEWKIRWQSQLEELKRRSKNSSRMSWAARMRNQI